MTESNASQLEEDLNAMTQFAGKAPQLWSRALETTRPPANTTRPMRDWFNRLAPSNWKWLQVAALLIVVLGVSLLAVIDPMSRARSAPSSGQYPSAADDALSGGVVRGFVTAPETPRSKLGDSLADPAETAGSSAEMMLGRGYGGPDFGPSDGTVTDSAAGRLVDKSIGQPAPAEQRQVVRKASVDLRSTDVRAAFVKVQMLVSEAGGEFIENSAISGEREQMQADLTLRVSASRVSEVLNSLRDIGKVVSQQLSGEDVTAQAVDLEARLNNERRVEAELLELLESRKDAVLKDVLELRQTISQVREQIERLQGQKQHLSRLVSLATVLIIIRHDDQPAKAEATGIGAYFADVMKSAWERGITGLADSLAWIAATLLGGLIWWTIAAIALWMAWRKFVAMRIRQETQGHG